MTLVENDEFEQLVNQAIDNELARNSFADALQGLENQTDFVGQVALGFSVAGIFVPLVGPVGLLAGGFASAARSEEREFRNLLPPEVIAHLAVGNLTADERAANSGLSDQSIEGRGLDVAATRVGVESLLQGSEPADPGELDRESFTALSAAFNARAEAFFRSARGFRGGFPDPAEFITLITRSLIVEQRFNDDSRSESGFRQVLAARGQVLREAPILAALLSISAIRDNMSSGESIQDNDNLGAILGRAIAATADLQAEITVANVRGIAEFFDDRGGTKDDLEVRNFLGTIETARAQINDISNPLKQEALRDDLDHATALFERGFVAQGGRNLDEFTPLNNATEVFTRGEADIFLDSASRVLRGLDPNIPGSLRLSTALLDKSIEILGRIPEGNRADFVPNVVSLIQLSDQTFGTTSTGLLDTVGRSSAPPPSLGSAGNGSGPVPIPSLFEFAAIDPSINPFQNISADFSPEAVFFAEPFFDPQAIDFSPEAVFLSDPINAFFGVPANSGAFFGFARGGSFEVGGVGGEDSQFARFFVTPGETITIDPPRSKARDADIVLLTEQLNAAIVVIGRMGDRLAAVEADNQALRQGMVSLSQSIGQRAVAAVTDARRRNPQMMRF